MNKKSILCIKYKTLSFFTADCLPFQCNQIKTILQNSKTTITTKQSCSLRGRLWGYTMMIMDQLDWMNCQGDLTKWLGVTFHPLASYLCQLIVAWVQVLPYSFPKDMHNAMILLLKCSYLPSVLIYIGIKGGVVTIVGRTRRLNASTAQNFMVKNLNDDWHLSQGY